MAGFGLPNFGQLTEAFKKAQEIQQNAQALQDELDGMEIEGQSNDGRASVWLSGNQQPLRVRLDPVSYTHLTLPTILLCRSRWSPYH